MGQASAVEVALAGAHHLGLALQAPERRRVDDPALVALVGVADVVGSRRLGLAPFLESPGGSRTWRGRSEEHTSELQSLMRISYAVFCLKKKNKYKDTHDT